MIKSIEAHDFDANDVINRVAPLAVDFVTEVAARLPSRLSAT